MHAGRMEDDATALAQGMREGSLVPVQVMRDHIERIRDLNPRLCAVAHSLVDTALKASEVMQSLDAARTHARQRDKAQEGPHPQRYIRCGAQHERGVQDRPQLGRGV